MLLNCGVMRRLLRVPWTARRSNQSVLKEISPGCSLEGLMLETPILWPPDAESWLIWKCPDAVKDRGQEEKGTTEDEMVGWHHQHNGHGFGWTQGVGDGQGGLVCCGLWGRKELDTTERLNWTEEIYVCWWRKSLPIPAMNSSHSRLTQMCYTGKSTQGILWCPLWEQSHWHKVTFSGPLIKTAFSGRLERADQGIQDENRHI